MLLCRRVRVAATHFRAVLCCIVGECGWLLHTAGQCCVVEQASVGGLCKLLGNAMLQCRRVQVAAAHCRAVQASAGGCYTLHGIAML